MIRYLPLILVLISHDAFAYRSAGVRIAVSQQRPPLDQTALPTACYSERLLLTSYKVNKSKNIVRASDSATLDVGFRGRLPDTATELGFCSGTTCKLVTLYDQCGTNNLTQAVDANRYARAAGPGARFNSWSGTTGTQTHVGVSNITPATGVASLSIVANRVAGTGACYFFGENGGTANRLQGANGAANSISIVPAGFSAPATDNTWHSVQGVLNGASSVISVDGTETTGTAAGGTTAAAPLIIGAASTTCNGVEAVVWDNLVSTAAQRISLTNNQRAFGKF